MVNINLGFVLIVSTMGWLLAIFLFTRAPPCSNEANDQIARQLEIAMNQLELLKKQNEALPADFRQIEADERPHMDKAYLELQNTLENANQMLKKLDDFKVNEKLDHSFDSTKLSTESDGSYKGVFEVERLYRKIYAGVKEMWYYTSSELKKLRSLSKDEVIQKRIVQILEEGLEHKRTLFVAMYNLSVANGRMDWVRKEIKDLEQIVERKLTALQNPSDCNTANKAVCDLNINDCGYGCQLHHTVLCLMMAFGTQRTMILKSRGWHYSPDGWESVFQPLSNTCVSDFGVTNGSWPPKSDTQVLELPSADIQVLELPPYHLVNPKPPFLPPAIPKDLSERLMTVHGEPSVWWTAQFIKFLTRPQEPLAQYLRDFMRKMKFQMPIVGVHVRRTDKVGTEAAFYPIEEYMHHVKEYYDTLALRQDVPVRRVYLASDDPLVYEDAKHKFPDYLFLGDPEVSESASMTNRYSLESLKRVVGDIYLLSHTDYLVCTFSSNLCRLVYEMMQANSPDSSANYQSLDYNYFFVGQQPRSQKVLYNHTPATLSGQLEMRVGDVINFGSNHNDGYSDGTNRRTGLQGHYPSFKAEDIIPFFEQNDNME